MRLSLAIAAAALVTTVSASAASVASDNASNYTSWTNGSNGGSGFGAWVFVGPSNNNPNNGGYFLSSSNGNGSTAGPGIDSAGKAFGLYANSGQNVGTLRMFTGGALDVGQTFSAQMDNGYIDNNSAVALSLGSFNIAFIGGMSTYSINTGSGVTTSLTSGSDLSFTDGGLTVALTRLANGTTARNYSLSLTRLSDNATVTYSLSGDSLTIDRFGFSNSNAGGGSAFDAYFNNFAITDAVAAVPLPGAAGAGAAVMGLMAARRKRA